MVRTRSIWLVCAALGALLSLIAVASASAILPTGETSLPGPGQAWTWQNPLPQGNGLVALAAAGDHIWTAGGTEAIYSSADRGVTWSANDQDADQTINSLVMDESGDGQTGWAVVQAVDGSGKVHATLLRTTDYGATWGTVHEFDPNVPVYCLSAIDAQTLFVGGENGWAAASTDGGATWDDRAIPMDDDYMAFVADLRFLDADHGYAATARKLYETTDAGANWSVLKEFPKGSEDPFDPHLDSVAVTTFPGDEADEHGVYITGSAGGAWRSMDGGASWEQSDLGGAKAANRVVFLNASYGLVTGNGGRVWSTDDGGTTWVPAQLPLDFNVFNACWLASGHVLACGQGGLLARSEDGGLTWARLGSGFPWTLYGAAFKDPQTGWAVGEGGYITHTEDGATWQRQRAARDSRAGLNAVAFPTYARGCAVGDKGTILTTTNGGEDWKSRSAGTRADFHGVAFAGAKDGWIVGGRRVDADTVRAVIYRTRDGGAHWAAQRVPAGVQVLAKVRFVDDRYGWAVGTPGVTLWTGDGGLHWHKVQLAKGANLLDLDFVDRKYGWVCGAIGMGGNIGYHTTDGGRTWTREEIPGDASYAVDFTDRKHGWRAGEFGHVIATTDGGATWRFLPESTPSQTLFDLRMWSDGTGYVAGQFGTIMKTETGGQGDN
jgi:photosystem II stability/assembly factor-like uncharacterized protein